MKLQNKNKSALTFQSLWYFGSSFSFIISKTQNLNGFPFPLLFWYGLWNVFLFWFAWFWFVLLPKMLGFDPKFIPFCPFCLFLILSSAAEISWFWSWSHFFPWASSHSLWILIGNKQIRGLDACRFCLFLILSSAAEISWLWSWYHFFPWASSHSLWILIGYKQGRGLFCGWGWLENVMATEKDLYNWPCWLLDVNGFFCWLFDVNTFFYWSLDETGFFIWAFKDKLDLAWFSCGKFWPKDTGTLIKFDVPKALGAPYPPK